MAVTDSLAKELNDSAFDIAVIVLTSIAIYNALELVFVIFWTFKRYKGLYFWSVCVASVGIALNAVGYLLKDLTPDRNGVLVASLILVGWCTMVTGQSLVLYSRLHLLIPDDRVLRAVLYMIICNAIIMHIPIIVLVSGYFSSADPERFVSVYCIYEKIQLSVFFLQEIIISGLYLWETTKLLHLERGTWGTMGKRRIMNHLILVNIIVIMLDITVLVFAFINLDMLQTGYKPLAYSIKLKLEFSVLGQLLDLVKSKGLSESLANNPANTHVSLGSDDAAIMTMHSRRSGPRKGSNHHAEAGEIDDEICKPSSSTASSAESARVDGPATSQTSLGPKLDTTRGS